MSQGLRVQQSGCFICEHAEATRQSRNGDLVVYDCPNCGQYCVKDFDGAFIQREEPAFFSKAPALAFERKSKGRDKYKLHWSNDIKQACIGNVPFLADYPNTFPEKLDRMLLNIARLTDFNPLNLTGSSHLPRAAFFLEKDRSGNEASIEIVLKLLKSEGLIEYKYGTTSDFAVNLTVKGAKIALELVRQAAGFKHAFLAMWFDPALDKFKDQVMSAIKMAGYIPQIVNEVHHNDFIMDKVLNLIKESCFVIADLTSAPEVVDGAKPSKGVRGGVYLEAGYAKGLGRQVIFTCRDDEESSKRIHFDVKQINTIFWNGDSNGTIKAFKKYDFIEYLKEHIIATVGKGPVPVEP